MDQPLQPFAAGPTGKQELVVGLHLEGPHQARVARLVALGEVLQPDRLPTFVLLASVHKAARTGPILKREPRDLVAVRAFQAAVRQEVGVPRLRSSLAIANHKRRAPHRQPLDEVHVVPKHGARVADRPHAGDELNPVCFGRVHHFACVRDVELRHVAKPLKLRIGNHQPVVSRLLGAHDEIANRVGVLGNLQVGHQVDPPVLKRGLLEGEGKEEGKEHIV